MPPIETWLTYAMASLLLCLSPGPSNLYIMARSIGQGYSAGMAAAAGMAIGSFLYVIATAFGLAVVFTYAPNAYLALKIAGAGYLVYLGIQHLGLFSKQEEQQPHLARKPLSSIFRQSILVELTNPKTALFFMAFLPQFTAPELGNVTLQLLALGILYLFIALFSDSLVVAMSGTLGSWMAKHPARLRWQDRIAGTMLLGIGGAIFYQEWTSFSSE